MTNWVENIKIFLFFFPSLSLWSAKAERVLR